MSAVCSINEQETEQRHRRQSSDSLIGISSKLLSLLPGELATLICSILELLRSWEALGQEEDGVSRSCLSPQGAPEEPAREANLVPGEEERTRQGSWLLCSLLLASTDESHPTKSSCSLPAGHLVPETG